jgi:hypothetical protein
MKINVSNFALDLEEGHSWEVVILNDVQKKYPKAYLNDDYKYDIYVPETGDSIEVKYDRLVNKTGNYFIETAFNDFPSGISTSQATFWVLIDKYNKIWIKADTLKYMVRDLPVREYKGEGHVVSGHLIRKSELLSSPYVKIYKNTH